MASPLANKGAQTPGRNESKKGTTIELIVSKKHY